MTLHNLWKRYANIWSMDTLMRDDELNHCLADDFSYCDPNGSIDGRGALSAYMGEFQKSAPGAKFRIHSVMHHHDRTLAHWSLIGPEGTWIQDGTSHGVIAADGRLRTVSGFFYAPGEKVHA